MANKITYWAILGRGTTVDRPLGLVRRLEHDDGPEDEALNKDLGWHWTSRIVEWERNRDDDLVEVSHEQASKIATYLRERFAAETS